MPLRRTLILLAVLLFAACNKVSPPDTTAPAPSGPGQVKGAVTARDSGDPLVQVSVSFYSDNGEVSGQSAFTDSRGNFSIELPAGKYRVLTNSATEAKPLGWNGYAPVWTNGELTDLDTQRFVVRTGTVSTYDAVLPKVWSCSGRVVASGGSISQGNVTAVKFRDGTVFASLPLPATGSYTFPLPDGEWQMQVDVPGFKQAVSTKFVVAGAPVTIPDVALSAA
ncbi:MAG: hypothetical protein DCC49_04545 [Acidobacteria bacterium]|nr:MAG: hypothetical protein DCC49_04545 [Acidobacteriota bacterium]